MNGRDDMAKRDGDEIRYWDSVGAAWGRDHPQRLWRAHADAVNRRLVEAWIPASGEGHLLKTDGFDEAVAEGVSEALRGRCARFTVIDLAPETLRRAAPRLHSGRPTAADVRALPFPDASFDTVLSLSTLDHFATREELIGSLCELRRVSAPGATLVLTLDNPQNPMLSLRGALPYAWLNRIGVVPYYVGVNLSPTALRGAIESAGFVVEEVRAMLHVPRVLAIPLSRVVQRFASDRGRARWLRWLAAFESLERLPTRFVTGHFVAVRARVPKT